MDATVIGSVFVSGSSSGIGHACVRKLADAGYQVYAGVRTDAGARAWARTDNVLPLIVDLTSRTQIEQVFGRMAERNDESPLRALVNNAGIMRTGPVEQLSITDVREVFETNLFGHWQLTQLCIPLLRTSRGRIVNIGSTNGRMSGPGVSAYSGAKHALEALTDTLRLELDEQGIAVSIIEPGAVKTALWDKVLDWESRHTPSTGCAAAVERRAQNLRHLRDHSTAPEAVADAVLHAIRDRRPKYRYVVGRDARIRVAMASLLSRQALHALRRLAR